LSDKEISDRVFDHARTPILCGQASGLIEEGHILINQLEPQAPKYNHPLAPRGSGDDPVLHSISLTGEDEFD
jgi:hypothetical protein